MDEGPKCVLLIAASILADRKIARLAPGRSPACEAAIAAWAKETNRKPESLLFAKRAETKLGRRNVLRDVSCYASGLGLHLRPGPSTASVTPSPRITFVVEAAYSICNGL